MVYGPLLGKRAAAAGAAGNAGGKGQGAFPRFYRCRIRRSRNACRQMVPAETAEATAAGALVIMPSNPAVKEIYGDNVIMYEKKAIFPALSIIICKIPKFPALKLLRRRK